MSHDDADGQVCMQATKGKTLKRRKYRMFESGLAVKMCFENDKTSNECLLINQRSHT